MNAFFDHRPITDIAIYTDPDRPVRPHRRPRPRARRPDAAPRRAGRDRAQRARGAAAAHRPGRGADDEDVEPGRPPGPVRRQHRESFPGFHGPRVRLHVVGVVRTLDGLTANVQRTSPYGFASPGFVAAHPGIGVWPAAVYVRHARRRRRASARWATSCRSADRTAPGVPATDEYQDAAQQAADDAATGLVVFAIAAALAGAFVVGQAIQRHLLLGGGRAAPARRPRDDADAGRDRRRHPARRRRGGRHRRRRGRRRAARPRCCRSGSPAAPRSRPGSASTGRSSRATGDRGRRALRRLHAPRRARHRPTQPDAPVARTRVPLLQRLVTRVGAPPAVGAGRAPRDRADGPRPARSRSAAR